MFVVGDEASGATATLTVKLGKLVAAGEAEDEATMELGSIEITFEGKVTASADDEGDGVVTDDVDGMADGAEVAVMTRPPAEGREDGDVKEIGRNELFPAATPFRSCNTFTVALPEEPPTG